MSHSLLHFFPRLAVDAPLLKQRSCLRFDEHNFEAINNPNRGGQTEVFRENTTSANQLQEMQTPPHLRGKETREEIPGEAEQQEEQVIEGKDPGSQNDDDVSIPPVARREAPESEIPSHLRGQRNESPSPKYTITDHSSNNS